MPPRTNPAELERDGQNRGMDETPWSKLKSEIYSLFGRNPKSNRQVVAIAELDAAHAVLDIGCGPGAAVRAAAESVAKAVGVDRSDAMVEIARRRSEGFDNVEFVTAGAEDLPFPDASFDRVWTIHSFHHWEDANLGLTESLRVLRPGGRLLIVENDTNGPHGLDRSQADELAERLRSTGFAEGTVSKPFKHLVVTGIRSD